LHLVGLLSSYFAHDARSQEPKVPNGTSWLILADGEKKHVALPQLRIWLTTAVDCTWNMWCVNYIGAGSSPQTSVSIFPPTCFHYHLPLWGITLIGEHIVTFYVLNSGVHIWSETYPPWIKGLKSLVNPLMPNDHYSGRTAPLTSKRCILYIYPANIGTEYFKHSIYSPFFLFKMQFVS